MNVYCLAFDDYETLDYMGVIEMLFRAPDICLHYVSYRGGLIKCHQGFEIMTTAMPDTLDQDDVLLVVGGMGTRTLIHDNEFIDKLGQWIDDVGCVLSVCTGAALVAKTGRLNHLNATSNKKSMQWVITQGQNVKWKTKARWIKDDKFYTSSGVSAGMDMALAFIADNFGEKVAQDIANHCEYHWQKDAYHDEFAALYGY